MAWVPGAHLQAAAWSQEYLEALAALYLVQHLLALQHLPLHVQSNLSVDGTAGLRFLCL